MNEFKIPYSIRVTGLFLLNLLIAVVGPLMADFALHIHWSRSFGTAMLQEGLITSPAAFVLGFSIYRLWRLEVAKWLWLAGICWGVPRILLTLRVSHGSSALGDFKDLRTSPFSITRLS